MSEWDQREVCPDGACTGVIGADGTCKVCGRAAPNWGDERKRGLLEPADEDDEYEDEDDDADEAHDPISPSAPAALGATGEWSERELCSDGACVGLLDDTGVCKVCGTKSPMWKPRVVRAPAPAEDAALRAAADDLAASIPAEAVAAIAPAPAREDDDDQPRALCPDGACVGVIGDDGKCKLCGKEAA